MPRKRPRVTKYEAFDTEVVLTAKYFTAILWQPRGQSRREEFATLPEAISAASSMRDEYGRRGLVYAVNAQGRSAELSQQRWLEFLELWARS